MAYNPNWWKISVEDLDIKQQRTASGSKKTLVKLGLLLFGAVCKSNVYYSEVSPRLVRQRQALRPMRVTFWRPTKERWWSLPMCSI